ncbi:hypothetical protein LCGC14_0862910 [marine sediment metagenome]|uniref:Uncharacterized protein n=1 Tax=marine sediment metagenome TaxID=412755 RepID=A0A0F9PBU7_9ZZZZ
MDQERINKEKEGFFKRWKQGILDMTIEQQLKNKIIGILGGMVGLTLALIIIVYRKQWGFSIFVFFIIWIQFISFISTRQQYIATKEMLKGLEPQKQDIVSPEIDKEVGNNK